MARSFPYGESRQLLLRPADGPPFFEGWDTQKDTGNHDLLCAELSRLAYADRATAAASLDAIGFSLPRWLGGETLEQRAQTLGTDAFVATSARAGLTIVAFRGTESTKPEDLVADALADSTAWTEAPDGPRVHEGFARVYAPVRGAIREALAGHEGRLLLTGHSLGAALATLAAADHVERRPTLITFGSPRVGDLAFTQLVRRVPTIRRFVGCCDVISRVPPERFEPPRVRELLADLTTEQGLDGPLVSGAIAVLASVLAGALVAFGIRPNYTHAGVAHYGTRVGTVTAGPPAEFVAADQRAARAAYRRGSPTTFKDAVDELASAVRAASDVRGVRDAVRRFGAALFAGARVPFRDLADHAPLNYVTLFTGRV